MIRMQIPLAGIFRMVFTAMMLWSMGGGAVVPIATAAVSGISSQEKAMEYGIFNPNLSIVRRSVRERQNLSQILQDEGISPEIAHEAGQKCDGLMDVRTIRVGNPYWVMAPEEAGSPRYIVYEKTPVEYVVFDLEDPVRVWSGKKPVMKQSRTAEGLVGASLWQTFSEMGLDVNLVMDLAEIYAWTIDFYHLDKEDRFRIFFEEEYVHGERVGSGRIQAACLTIKEKDHFAFFFEPSGRYYDETGQSLRKAFLSAPLKYTRISSGYSKQRLHPILKTSRPHLGIDYAAPTGTPIMALGDGIVEKAESRSAMGRYVQIRHNQQYMTQYLHMSRYAKGIRPGKRVQQGDIIGYVGSSGLATGPHLDFRFWIGGKAVNFLKQNNPAAKPIPAEHRDAYRSLVAEGKSALSGARDSLFSATGGPRDNPLNHVPEPFPFFSLWRLF